MVHLRVSDFVSFASDQANKVALADGDHCRVTLWCLEAGQAIHPHVHAGDHVWLVREGSGWFLTGDERVPVEPGSLLFAPAGEVHGMEARTPLTFVSITAG